MLQRRGRVKKDFARISRRIEATRQFLDIRIDLPQRKNDYAVAVVGVR